MKYLKNIFFAVALIFILISCERELESEGITTGVIRYPAILIEGEDPLVIMAGSEYEDAGATATLGTDDITSQMTTNNQVDTSTPGVYTVDYEVSATNELDQESTVNASRIVSVTDGDVCDVDLAGAYLRNPNSADVTVNVVKVKCGVFDLDNVFARTTFVSGVRMYAIGNDQLSIPLSDSPFGRMYGEGEITPEGFSITMELLDPPNTGVILIRDYELKE